MEKAAEKRKFSRIPNTIKVVYSIEGDPAKANIEAVTNNIGEGGILLYVAEPLPVSAKIDLGLYSPRLPFPIKTKSKIVWVNEIKPQLYEVGIAFCEIKDADSRLIRKWVRTVDLDKILLQAVKKEASDIHFISEQPPIMRIFGELTPAHSNPLSADEVKGMVYEMLNDQQKEQFERDLELDFSYVNDTGRFRVNIHQEKGQVGMAIRYIPTDVKTITELCLPVAIKDLAHKPNGLILVTGPIGSGKSTTLAAMIEVINKERKCIVMSLEEPIEYLYKSKKSYIEQREIGMDARSFQNALKYTVRQDVDVILIGEIRDLESITIALTAAETGHLVLTTLHTIDTISTINRIIDVFPANQQQQIRMQLAETLRGIISQVLLPRKDREGRIVAAEVLVATPAVSNTIRRGNLEELHNMMTMGAQYGMRTMDRSLEELYNDAIVSLESILPYVKDLSRFT
jgi:twitching motility protein PilT